ncbi:hypothetical protein T4A_13606 [Trichinella pseudospiralis]|uniref:Uncharacterized protein n=1 Tax=Trichinella pseudospiralis TaxID=6337 RepID=A0A0V1DVT0_TRIPS|nr:hypothetical protein T4A_13606 [Trichinella pseudospiralis]
MVTLANSSGSVEDCVTRICKSTTSTEVTLDGHLIACAIRHGHRSYKTPVPVYPDRLLVYHELVPCCWNSSMKETRWCKIHGIEKTAHSDLWLTRTPLLTPSVPL